MCACVFTASVSFQDERLCFPAELLRALVLLCVVSTVFLGAWLLSSLS